MALYLLSLDTQVIASWGAGSQCSSLTGHTVIASWELVVSALENRGFSSESELVFSTCMMQLRTIETLVIFTIDQ